MEGKWKNLPKDILDLIVNRLNSNDFDILHLRAVCSSWRSLVPLSKDSPFQLPCWLSLRLLSISDSNAKFSPFVVQLRTMLLVSPPENYANTVFPGSTSSPSWIIQVVESSMKKLSLLDPFSGQSNECFPKCAQLPESVNLMNYKISVIDQSYNLDYLKFFNSNGEIFLVQDVILSTVNESFVLFILDVYGSIEYQKYGMEEWVSITKGPGHCGFAKMIQYKNRIYAVDFDGGLTVIDAISCEIVQNVSPSNEPIQDPTMCLGEFHGYLYLVIYHFVNITHIDLRVYVLDEENRTLVRKNELGGGVFLVHDNTMFCVSAKKVGVLKSDCVYFYGYLCNDAEVGGLGECNISDPDTIGYDLRASEIFVYERGLNRAPFWPPPKWVKMIEERSHRCLA